MAYDNNFGGGGGASTFLTLTDTPSSFSGEGTNVVSVNAGETALEFTAAGGGTFLSLSDTPGSYPEAYRLVGVNSTNDGLAFPDIITDASHNLIPGAGNTRDLGTILAPWRYGYFRYGISCGTGSTQTTYYQGGITAEGGPRVWLSVEADELELFKGQILEGYHGTGSTQSHNLANRPMDTDPWSGVGIHNFYVHNASYNVADRHCHITSVQWLTGTTPAAGTNIHEWGIAIATQGNCWLSSSWQRLAAFNIDGYNCGTSTAESSVLFTLENPTAAAAGAQQNSGSLRLRGQGWKTDATAETEYVDFFAQTHPIQGAAAPSGDMMFSVEINETGHTNLWSINSAGFTQYEVAQDADSLPASPAAGAVAYFSNGNAGAACMAWFDGTNWRVYATTSDTIVSST